MTPERDPGHKDLLGRALRAHDQGVTREKSREEAELHLCPPDPELDALFIDFAQRMRRSQAVPFVGQAEEQAKKGLWSRKRSADAEKVKSYEITRGWPIDKVGEGATFSTGKYGSDYIWNGLAVDIDGHPWLATHGHSSKELRVEGVKDQYQRLSRGRPRGADLRVAIIRFCSFSNPNINVDNLPEFIAQGMAETLRRQ